MNEKKITSLGDPAEVPENMTEEEEREFWDTHGVTEEFLDKAGPVLEGMLPPARPRTRPIAVRFDDDTLGRLRFLAKKSTKATRRCSRSSSPSASTKRRSAKALFKRGDIPPSWPRGTSEQKAWDARSMSERDERVAALYGL